jgi:hypothetical protein
MVMDQQEQASIERAPADDDGVRGIMEVHSPDPDAPARTRVVRR